MITGMYDLSEEETTELCTQIASRAVTAAQLMDAWNLSYDELNAFVDVYRKRLEVMRTRIEKGLPPEEPPPQLEADVVTPDQLDALWITNKYERLRRYQELADIVYQDARDSGLTGADLSTALREFRSYLTTVANELGQLMHRGSGERADGDSVSYNITGVDMETMK